jgi:hypothetical protein
MSLLRQSLVWIACGAAVCAQARANDLGAAQAQPPRTSAAKVKPLKPPKLAPSRADGLGGVKFSDPYAPPDGTRQAKTGELPVAPKPAPTEPKGGVSITYKWHATNEPTDPYWHVRNSGPDAPGSTFLGGLKLGF